MNPMLFALILLSVTMSAVAQMLLKLGVAAAKLGTTSSSGLPTVVSYLLSPMVIGGLALYGLGAVVWLFVLARLPLSAAYPFVGIGFIITMAIGALALGESLSSGRIAGTLLIAAGCVCVARSIG